MFATHIWNQVNPLSTSSPESFSRNLLRFLHMMREPGVPWEVFSSGKPKYFTSPKGTLWLSQTSSCQNTSQPWVRCIWWKKMKLITKTASGNLSRELGTQVESFGLQLEKAWFMNIMLNMHQRIILTQYAFERWERMLDTFVRWGRIWRLVADLAQTFASKSSSSLLACIVTVYIV